MRKVITFYVLRFNILMNKLTLLLMTVIIIIVFVPIVTANGIEIVSNSQPVAVIIIGQTASEQEWYAASELNYFVSKFTETQLKVIIAGQSFSEQFAIILGTPESNSYVRDFQNSGLIKLSPQLGSEGYILKTSGGQEGKKARGQEGKVDEVHKFLIAAGNSSIGVLYGVYAIVEVCITALTGLNPVDLDFTVEVNPNLALPFILPSWEGAGGGLDEEAKPFYPIRATLEVESPDWLARHRINMSGAEGVWTGTGSDDGLGTAFKYIDAPEFEDMQDEPQYLRQQRIRNLQNRFSELRQRGIDSYLFMYVTGEPTKAIISNHPELLAGEVLYGGSRNLQSYRPFCWSKPEFRDLVRRLIKEIVRTYPSLSGFHLRSWGYETRASESPECGDFSERGQELLWQLYFDIINAARQIRPDFKFYISGYDAKWLKDPQYIHVQKLPPGTIISQKWGIDGEPVPDPGIPIERINTVGKDGRHFLILSHDVEEVMPFWMVESDLFVEGVRKYAMNPDVHGLSGFTLQGQNGFSHLDKLVSAKINWSPDLDYETFMQNYFTNLYGQHAAEPKAEGVGERSEHILSGLRINAQVLSDYFTDYAGSISFLGQYKRGSSGLATRFWNLIGSDAVANTLAIPSLEIAQYAEKRFSELLPKQQRADNEMTAASEAIQFPSVEAQYNFEDAQSLMQIWTTFFESRLRLVEAINMGWQDGKMARWQDGKVEIQHKLDSAIEYSKKLIFLINSFHSFVPMFNFSDEYTRSSLVKAVESEVEFLSNFDVCNLIRSSEELYNQPDEENEELDILKFLNYPNPFADSTYFTYILTRGADDVTISIYTVSGRKIMRIDGASAFKGYNEELWNGYTQDGKRLANGVYLYKIVAKLEGRKVEKVGKLGILR
jgi:hypothetical protein